MNDFYLINLIKKLILHIVWILKKKKKNSFKNTKILKNNIKVEKKKKK